MKKQITFLIALVLVFTFALSACGKSKSDKTDEVNTINFPVVDVGGGEPSGNPDISAAPAQETYPVEAQQSTFDPAMAYPFNPSSPTYDSEMEAYLKALVGEKHDLQFLLDKNLNVDQWREILLNVNHTHLQLTEGAMQAIINWLISK